MKFAYGSLVTTNPRAEKTTTDPYSFPLPVIHARPPKVTSITYHPPANEDQYDQTKRDLPQTICPPFTLVAYPLPGGIPSLGI